ncbi:ankyrin repeat domain-containing protein, partial [Sansalvadorimonas verongulae]|uniref:ankyrin repeat domain-containing protein n=1 Tax=Sansalvadorimonas verongulae TaxID=2172824 RepID=UPI0018AD20C8
QILVNTEGVDVNQTWDGATPLFMASQNGHARVVQILVNTEGVDVNQGPDYGITPLFIASQEGHTEVVEILVNTEGVNANPVQDDGATPLFQASQEGHAEVVQTLLDAGANPLPKRKYDIFLTKSPLSVAKHSKPLFRNGNPDKWDRYTKIIKALEQAIYRPNDTYCINPA